MKNISLTTKRAIAKAAKRYQSATKKQKGAMLTRLTESLGYTRNSLSWILTRHGKKARIIDNRAIEPEKGGRRRGRPKGCDRSLTIALKTLWVTMNFPSGNRMAAGREEALEDLERGGRITLDQRTKQKLLKISPRTIDRLLAPEKKKRARRQTRKVKLG